MNCQPGTGKNFHDHGLYLTFMSSLWVVYTSTFCLGMWTLCCPGWLILGRKTHTRTHAHTRANTHTKSRLRDSGIDWMKWWYKETNEYRSMHLIHSNTANKIASPIHSSIDYYWPCSRHWVLDSIDSRDNEQIQCQNSTRKGWLWTMSQPHSNATNSPNTLSCKWQFFLWSSGTNVTWCEDYKRHSTAEGHLCKWNPPSLLLLLNILCATAKPAHGGQQIMSTEGYRIDAPEQVFVLQCLSLLTVCLGPVPYCPSSVFVSLFCLICRWKNGFTLMGFWWGAGIKYMVDNVIMVLLCICVRYS